MTQYERSLVYIVPCYVPELCLVKNHGFSAFFARSAKKRINYTTLLSDSVHPVEEIYWKSPYLFNVVFFGSTQTLRYDNSFLRYGYPWGTIREIQTVTDSSLCLPTSAQKTKFVIFSATLFILWRSSGSRQGLLIFHMIFLSHLLFQNKLRCSFYNNNYSVDIPQRAVRDFQSSHLIFLSRLPL